MKKRKTKEGRQITNPGSSSRSACRGVPCGVEWKQQQWKTGQTVPPCPPHCSPCNIVVGSSLRIGWDAGRQPNWTGDTRPLPTIIHRIIIESFELEGICKSNLVRLLWWAGAPAAQSDCSEPRPAWFWMSPWMEHLPLSGQTVPVHHYLYHIYFFSYVQSKSPLF